MSSREHLTRDHEPTMMPTTTMNIPDAAIEAESNNNNNTRNNDNNNNTDTAPVIDNPCWGTPTSCDLQDLLAILETGHNQPPPSLTLSTTAITMTTSNDHTATTFKPNILYESMDYIVLNKPPDLRMDGNYPATVTKLLLYFYPPVSLLQIPLSSSSSQLDSNPTKKLKSFPTTATNTTDIDASMHTLPHCDNKDDYTSRNIDNDDGDLKRPNDVTAAVFVLYCRYHRCSICNKI